MPLSGPARPLASSRAWQKDPAWAASQGAGTHLPAPCFGLSPRREVAEDGGLCHKDRLEPHLRPGMAPGPPAPRSSLSPLFVPASAGLGTFPGSLGGCHTPLPIPPSLSRRKEPARPGRSCSQPGGTRPSPPGPPRFRGKNPKQTRNPRGAVCALPEP